jgi:hypothetical protein
MFNAGLVDDQRAMREYSSEVSDKRPSLQDFAPLHRWPMVVFAILALAIYLSIPIFQANSLNTAALISYECIGAAFAVLAALVAMSRHSITDRVKLFSALLLAKTVLCSISVLFSLFYYPHGWPQFQLYEIARSAFCDLRDFAAVIALAHGLSALTMTFVSPAMRETTDVAKVKQGRIADWLYLVAFVSLAFLKIWPEGTMTINANQEPVFVLMRFDPWYGLITGTQSMSIKLGAVATGLICISLFAHWRVACLMFAVLAAQSIFCSVFVMDENMPFFGLFGLFFALSLASLPFWLLLRAAGYRLHSPRK